MNDRLPTIKVKELIRILERMGFAFRRQKGSHATYAHPDGRRVTVPVHPRDLPRSIFKQIIKNLKMDEDEFIRWL